MNYTVGTKSAGELGVTAKKSLLANTFHMQQK